MFIYKGNSNPSGRSFIPGVPARDLTDAEAELFIQLLNFSKEQIEEAGGWDKLLTRNGLYIRKKKIKSEKDFKE